MIKLLILAIVAGLVFESHQHFPNIDDHPDHDENDLSSQTAHDDYHEELEHLGHFSADPSTLSEECYYPKDTRCWTEWFDRDDPCRNGDRELISDLLDDYPGKMCSDPIDIEVETLSGIPVSETGDVIHRMDTERGFICRNRDQSGDRRCHDYRVRFSCYSPFCASPVCWTQWFNRDVPSGTGDWEILEDLREENPGKICEKPLFIEVVTADSSDPATSTGESFSVFNPTEGFACRKADQPDDTCEDYKVRFACPCKIMIPYW